MKRAVTNFGHKTRIALRSGAQLYSELARSAFTLVRRPLTAEE